MTTNEHPSNVLYRGECHDIREALRLMVAQYEREAATQDEQEMPSHEMLATARKCRDMLDEYDDAVKYAEEDLIAKWGASGDRDKEEWACLFDLKAWDKLAV